jgi:uncharacterized surface protein with fasciclin (FAS1) repeats
MLQKNKHNYLVMKTIAKKIVRLATIVATVMLVLTQCKDEVIDSRTINVPLIGTYIAENPNYSDFNALLDTTGFKSFLKAYGIYTCFVPDNEAFNKYESRKGISNWRSLSMDQLKNIVKYLVIRDTLPSKSFGDGKLSAKNMYGHYLSGGSVDDNGIMKIRINKLAFLKEYDIRVENGIIHIIDDVIEPPVLSIAEVVEGMTDYTIFTEALKQTGWYDTIKVIWPDTAHMKWYTILAESDAVFQQNKISSYNDLKLRFCNTGNPKSPTDSLNLFIAYHIIGALSFASDLPTTSSFDTKAPNEVVTTSASGDSVHLNRMVIAGKYEPGVSVLKNQSDFFSANGVFNAINGLLTIKVRNPYPIYWDICEQPELANLSGFRKIIGFNYAFPSNFKDNYWKNFSWHSSATKNALINYVVGDSVMSGAYPHEKNRFVYNDIMAINFRLHNTSNGVDSVVFTSPFVPKGEYKLWVCHGMKSDNRELRTSYLDVYVDGKLMPNQIYEWVVLDTAMSDADLEFLGYKRYIWEDMPTPVYNNVLPKDLKNNFVSGSVYVGRLVGKVNFTKHGSHRITIACNSENVNAGQFYMDMIHIIPAEDDQVIPCFNYKGEKIYKYHKN